MILLENPLADAFFALIFAMVMLLTWLCQKPDVPRRYEQPSTPVEDFRAYQRSRRR